MKKMFKVIIALTFFLFYTISSASAEICEVDGIIDGDSLTVSCENYSGLIKISGIDSPEIDQDFGVEAKLFLENLVNEEKLNILNINKSKKEGKILLETGRNIGSRIVDGGYAWSIDRKESDRNYFLRIEKDARRGKKGMWVTDDNTPPWKYRKELGIVDDEQKALNDLMLAMHSNDSSNGGCSNSTYSNFSECFKAEQNCALSGVSKPKSIEASLFLLNESRAQAALICGGQFNKKVTVTRKPVTTQNSFSDSLKENRMREMADKIDNIDRKLRWGY